MSLLVQAQTSDDDDEILDCLQLVLESSKLGLVHESINVNYAHSYTRTFSFSMSVYNTKLMITPRELVCLGERGIRRDDIGPGATETSSHILRLETV